MLVVMCTLHVFSFLLILLGQEALGTIYRLPNIDFTDKVNSAENLIPNGSLGKISRVHNDSLGEELILTPYIESGNYSMAKSLSRVVGIMDVPSYSGFFTVNKKYNSNLFFWFFPAERNYETAPIILWLEGGPGVTGLVGLFSQFGPYFISEDLKIVKNPHSWTTDHSLIFVDSPVGTGFSFTENDEGFATNTSEVAEDLYVALTQFFSMFSELKNLSFYIAGESYGGKFVPALAYKIHQENVNAKTKINLNGIMVGNGLTDPTNMIDYSGFLYQVGLVDTNTYNQMRSIESTCKTHIRNRRYLNAYLEWVKDLQLFLDRSNYTSYQNILRKDGSPINTNFFTYVQQFPIRKSIHVGNQKFGQDQTVVQKMLGDYMVSERGSLEKLLSHYRVLYYNGNLDIVVAYSLSVQMYKQLKFSGSSNYLTATRVPWYVDGELAGYVKSGGNFTEVMVRNAGHVAIVDKPHWIRNLITGFTYNNVLSPK